MDRSDRARRRAAFGRLWEADAQAKSLAHGLELEEEAEREEAASGPHVRRRARRWLVVRAVAAVFIVSTFAVLILLVQSCQSQIFMRDHGVIVQGVVVDKALEPSVTKGINYIYGLKYRFSLRNGGGYEEGRCLVGEREFDSTYIGQTVSVIYNPNRPSQSGRYADRPLSDLYVVARAGAVFATWLFVFGGICALIVGLAWPEPIRPRARFGRTRQAGLSS
jgi:hypothetical protein